MKEIYFSLMCLIKSNTHLLNQKIILCLQSSFTMFKLLLSITLSLSCLSLAAQFNSDNNFKFKTYTTADGLAHNFTLKCRMDSKGFLWVITQNGLSRFDGVHFTNYQHQSGDSSSLPFNELSDIAIDGQDRIWLAYNRGLCYYDQGAHRFITIKENAFSICYDSTGNKIWYNTINGLFAINLKTMQKENSLLATKYSNKPAYMSIDSKRKLWISIEREGYYIYDLNKNIYQYINNQCWPRNIYEDNEGEHWISTWGTGLQLFDNATGLNKGNIYHLPMLENSDMIYQDVTQSLPLTGKDNIWVLMHTSGLALYNKPTHQFIQWWQYDPSAKSGIATDFNSSLYTDKNGIVWICTWKGLTKVNPQEQQFQSSELKFLQTSDYNLLTSIFDDPYDSTKLWLSAEGCGIGLYDKKNQKIVQWYFKNTNHNSYALNYNWKWTLNGIMDKRKVLWFSTYGGFIKVDHGKVDTVRVEYEHGPTYAFNTNLFSDGGIWMSTSFGLIRFDPFTEQYKYIVNTSVHPEHYKFYALEELDAANLMAATNKGLIKVDKATGNCFPIRVSQTDTAKKEWVVFYALQKIRHKVYAASPTGLMEVDLNTLQTRILGKEQEIFKLQPYSLKKDAGDNLWIYTLHGLFKYRPEKEEFNKFSSADGIYDNSSDPVQLFDYHNDFYIGYRMAFTRFDPTKVNVNHTIAQPFITDVFVNHSLLKLDPDFYQLQTLVLPDTSNNIRFDFTAIDYTNSEKITFSYMLEGFDADWISAGTIRTVNYANLRGGHYVFKLKACNSSGIRNEQPIIFQFDITPRLWQRWWFWPLILLLFSTLVIWIAKKRIDRIRKKEAQETADNKARAELEIKFLRSQMNPHFIFNSLNSVQKYIWENKEEDAAEYLASFAKLMRAILENSQKETVTLKKEMEIMKLYIELEHRRSNGHFDYTIRMDETLDLDKVQIPPLLLQPFIENAIWHGLNKKESKGNLLISIEQNKENLVCIIEDDGVGRSFKQEGKVLDKKSLGIEITKQRIHQLMHDRYSENSLMVEDKIESGIPSGTKVIITIPITLGQIDL